MAYPEYIKEIAVFISYLLAAAFAGWAAGKLWVNVLRKFSSLTRTDLDDALINVSYRPVKILVFLLVIKMGKQHLEAIVDWGKTPFLTWFDHTVFVLAIILITYWLDVILRVLVKWFVENNILTKGRTKLANHILILVRRLAAFIVYFVGFTIILSHFNVDITGLIATAGVASLAIALAAQDTLGNMISGIMIMLDRPFHEGDRIELSDGLYGDVLEIGPRTCKIQTRQKTVIVVPNQDIASSRIINYCYPDTRYRLVLEIGVAYGTNVQFVKSLIKDILNKHPKVLDEPAPEVLFKAFGESSLVLEIFCWIPHPRDRKYVRDEIYSAINDTFESKGIEIPFPQRDIHIKK